MRKRNFKIANGIEFGPFSAQIPLSNLFNWMFSFEFTLNLHDSGNDHIYSTKAEIILKLDQSIKQ